MPTVEQRGKGQVIIESNADWLATYKHAYDHDAVTSILATEEGVIWITLKNPEISPVRIFPKGKIQFWFSQMEGLMEIFRDLKDIVIPVEGDETHLVIEHLSFPSGVSLEMYVGLRRAERIRKNYSEEVVGGYSVLSGPGLFSVGQASYSILAEHTSSLAFDRHQNIEPG